MRPFLKLEIHSRFGFFVDNNSNLTFLGMGGRECKNPDFGGRGVPLVLKKCNDLKVRKYRIGVCVVALCGEGGGIENLVTEIK